VQIPDNFPIDKSLANGWKLGFAAERILELEDERVKGCQDCVRISCELLGDTHQKLPQKDSENLTLRGLRDLVASY